MSERGRTPRRGRRPKNGAVRKGERDPLAALGRPATLAAFADAGGRLHRVTRRGRLVLDECPVAGPPRVVCELGDGEGRAEAKACLEAGGYIEWAQGEDGVACRTLCATDFPEAATDTERRAA